MIEPNSPSCGYIPPECEEGEHETLRYCSDEVTEHEWRNCVGGEWVYGSQECPVPSCICTGWEDAGCVSETERRYVRTCDPSGCEPEVWDENDPSCASPVPPDNKWLIAAGAAVVIGGAAIYLLSKK